ncbi:MAG: hypothetical protein OEU36_18720 [Gammaproteobacteria bacterium]|nr:hypothetical protein [Gammaproteobacteria bacterium]
MNNRLLLSCVLAIGLSTAALADVQYGIDVEQEELLFMMAQHNTATNLELGRFGVPNYAEAIQLYRKAAVLGYPLAQNSLGRLYEMGRGAPQSYVLAYVWYTIAATNGDDNAVANRDAAAKRLTKVEILDSQALARQLQLQLP